MGSRAASSCSGLDAPLHVNLPRPGLELMSLHQEAFLYTDHQGQSCQNFKYPNQGLLSGITVPSPMNVRNLHQRFVHQHAACHKEENWFRAWFAVIDMGGLCGEENQEPAWHPAASCYL